MIELGSVIKPGLVQFSHSVTSNSATPWTAACQASLSITNSGSLLKLSCPSSQWCHPTSHPLSSPSPPSSLLLSHFQSCPTLCEPIDGSPPGCPLPGILQTRTLEWAAISVSNAGKWKVKVKLLSHIQLLATHGLQPTRLCRPWDFPGKSIGVGCHCLLPIKPGGLQKSCFFGLLWTAFQSHWQLT